MPTAEQAQKRYDLGTVSNKMPKMFPSLQRRLSGMRDVKVTTVLGNSGPFSNPASISQITGYRGERPDTFYVETPKHMPFIQAQPRMAGKAPDNPFMDYSDAEAQEYNILGRRFNQAESVSVKEQGGTMQLNEAARRLLAAAIAFCVSQQIQPSKESITKVMPQVQQLMKQQPQQFEELALAGELMLQQAELQQVSKQTKVAKLGTKLDYLNKLKGVCPEGSEKVYLKNGGCMCKQKAEKGTELKNEQPKNVKIEKKKCGGKKAKKHLLGGPAEVMNLPLTELRPRLSYYAKVERPTKLKTPEQIKYERRAENFLKTGKWEGGKEDRSRLIQNKAMLERLASMPGHKLSMFQYMSRYVNDNFGPKVSIPSSRDLVSKSAAIEFPEETAKSMILNSPEYLKELLKTYGHSNVKVGDNSYYYPAQAVSYAIGTNY